MKTPLLVSILLSSICLSGCSDSKYVDPGKACSFYDQINYGNVKSFSFEGGTYHLPNQTTSFYETTDTVALRKLVDCFKKGMSTLTKTGKTVEVSYNDYSGPSFSFSTEEATNYVHLDMFGYYFSSDPDLLLYSTDFDFSSVFEGKDLLVRFSYLLAPPVALYPNHIRL